MDFPRLRVFRAVAQHLSFTRAADELHLSQPAVSKHIHQLEAELSTRLFQRVGNRVELTDAGRLLADYAQRVSVMTEEVRRVLGELEGVERGYLRIGASSTPGLYLLPGALARFQKKYPGLELTLTITNSTDIAHRVLKGEIDLGFVGATPAAPGVQVQPLADDEIVLIVPFGHVLARRPLFAPEMLARETLITREPGSGTRQIVEEGLARWKLEPKRRLELSGGEAVKRAVAAGLGVAWVPECAITLEVAHKVVSVPQIPQLRLKRQLYLLNRKEAQPSAASLAFLALMRKNDGDFRLAGD